MRIFPLAIWGYRLGDEELAYCAHQDAILSHPHENCQVQIPLYLPRFIMGGRGNGKLFIAVWVRSVAVTPSSLQSNIFAVSYSFSN